MQKTQAADLEQWHFEFGEGGLSPSAHIESIAEECKLFRPPTIVFGANYMQLTNKKHNDFKIVYNVKEALRYMNFQTRDQFYYKPDQQPKIDGISYMPKKLQIKHAQKWKHIETPKQIEITEIKQSSDSFFITPFKGKLIGNYQIQRVKENVIPVHKLGPENVITFYKQGSIYEDQLDDNGLIQYEYKFRSMAESWFGLIRCYVRVDDVIVQIIDTRLYWQKGWDKFARQFMVKQCTWVDLKSRNFELGGGWTTNPHQSHLVYEKLDQVFVENQYIHLK